MIKQRSNNFSSLSCVTVPKTAPPPTKTACPPTFTVMPREVVTYQFLVRFSQIFFHWCIVWSRLFPNTIRNFSVDFTSMFKVSERYAYRFLRQTKNHDRTTHPQKNIDKKERFFATSLDTTVVKFHIRIWKITFCSSYE